MYEAILPPQICLIYIHIHDIHHLYRPGTAFIMYPLINIQVSYSFCRRKRIFLPRKTLFSEPFLRTCCTYIPWRATERSTSSNFDLISNVYLLHSTLHPTIQSFLLLLWHYIIFLSRNTSFVLLEAPILTRHIYY